MIGRIVLGATLIVTVGCGQVAKPVASAPNRWGDERLWPVLDAQEHRDTERLCALLKDTSATVREAAALALASVQDTLSVPCLLHALQDTTVGVRRTAVFALGFVADSATITQLAQHALNEPDTTVQRAFLSASFLAMQRRDLLKDPMAIRFYLEESLGHERIRAADVLRRLPDTTLAKFIPELAAIMDAEKPEVRQFLLLAQRKLGERADTALLHRIATNAGPGERVNAVRVLGALAAEGAEAPLLPYLRDPETGVRTATIELLADRPCSPALAALDPALVDQTDAMTWIPAYGIVARCGDAERTKAMRKPFPQGAPYAAAARLTAFAGTSEGASLDELLLVLNSKRPAVERQAALQAAIKEVRNDMARSRYTSREAQYGKLGSVLREAVNTGDAGLICAVADELSKEDAEVIALLFPAETERKALAALAPIRDLEGRILLQQLIAKRDGLPEPTHQRPPFNHPIDPTKLRALKQGQRYRIVTTKGEVIIATDVNECPGSSLAFDSLVVAGYYNGKAFHRMVPNFVAQGGCPRGDGYGGMDWTLRTEIGRTPFTAGSVGLASAGPDTESCQFFITHSATPHLDGRYTRFGEVVSGMDVVWMLQVGDVMQRVERME